MAIAHSEGIKREYIATFFTHYGASQFARILRKGEIQHRMMPVPRSLSSSCGTCVRFWIEDIQPYLYGEDLEGIYEIQGKNYCAIIRHE